MKLNQPNKSNVGWIPLSFNGLQKRLTTLKYKCMHCDKFNRKEINIDISDVMEKFKKADLKFDIKRQ